MSLWEVQGYGRLHLGNKDLTSLVYFKPQTLVWGFSVLVLILIIKIMAFIRIGEERFKLTSVSAYSFVPVVHPMSSKFTVRVFFGRVERVFVYDTLQEAQGVVKYLDGVLGFLQIGSERFRVHSVSSYSFSEVPSPNTNQFYLKVRFGRRERLFAYDTLQEARNMVYFLDEVLKCKEA